MGHLIVAFKHKSALATSEVMAIIAYHGMSIDIKYFRWIFT